MESDRAERLKWARERAGFESPRAAAKNFRWNENTYKAREGGLRDYGVGEAKEYGRAFDVSWVWLLSGEGVVDARNIVRVLGLIGAGAEISPEFEQVPPEGLSQIEVPFPVPDDAIAFEVQGDSMWPRYDPGDVVVCWKFSEDISGVLGWEAAVRTSDGRRFLKRILKGAEPDTFDLESYNAPPIRGVRLEWVGQVSAVVRASDWHRRTEAQKRRLGKRLVAAPVA